MKNSPENFAPGGAEAQSAIRGEIAKTDCACPVALQALEFAYHVGPDPYLAAAVVVALNGSAQGQDQFEQQISAQDAVGRSEGILTIKSAQQLVEDAYRAA